MSKLCELEYEVRILNFFTVSNYAPRTDSGSIPGTTTVSDIRAREDRCALRFLHSNLKESALGLSDAPLRFGIGADAVCAPESAFLQSQGEIEYIAGRIRKYFRHGCVIAPLGLGDHVDHLTIRAASIAVNNARHLAFYEDLPYASWTSSLSIDQRVAETINKTGVRLRPCIVRASLAIWRKYAAANRYHSQITPREARQIASFAAHYQGGERLWVPQPSKAWNSLIQDLSK